MGRLGPILAAALIWGGCHLVFPFEVTTEADGPPSLDAEVGPPADLKLGDGDAPISLTMEIEVPQPPEVRVGRHVPVVLVLSGYQGSVAVQAAAEGGCLLALPGKARAVESIKVEQLSPGKLLTHLFAPPGVQPGTQCSVKFALPGMKPSVTLTVTAPENEILFLQSDAISGMQGLKVTHLGELQHGGRIRAMVVAGGTFGGDFVVGTDWRDGTGNPVDPSTVRLYRFKGDISQPQTILPALDMYGIKKNPTVLDGLAWSASGPCNEALYLAAADRDYKYGTDQYTGSISCVNSDLKTPQLVVNDKRAKAVAVVPSQGFFPKADVGSLLFSTDSTTYIYPGYDIVDFIGDGTNQMVFAPSGPYKGHLYMIKSFPPSYPLIRISPPPGQKETILHSQTSGDTRIRFTLSTGGTFGPLVLTAVPGSKAEYYHVVALVEDGGGGSVHMVTLLKEVPCGRFIMDPKGNYLLLLAPPSDKVCVGPWSIYRVEFDLP